MTRTIATSRCDDDRDESPIQTHRQGPSSGSTTAGAALPYDSPSPYALTGWAKSVRRRRDDGRARARWCQHQQTRSTIDRNTKTGDYAERYLYATNPPGNRFRLTNSYRNGQIDGAAGLISAPASLVFIGRFCLAARCRGGALPICQPLPAEHRGKLAARACSSDGCGERLRMVSQIRGREVCRLIAPGDQSLE